MLKDEYAAVINRNLPNNTKALKSGVVKFIDRNGAILLNMDLAHRYSFGDADRKVLYDACGVTEEQMVESIRKSPTIHKDNKIQSNPFYVTMMLAASHYLAKKDDQMAKMVLTYGELQMYTSQHRGFYKFECSENVMSYTIANLDASFSIRQFPSLFLFLEDNVKTCIETYRTRIIQCTDKDITWVIDAIWTRLKGKMKKIASKFYENHKDGKYLNADTESFDSEDYRMLNNVSFAIDRLTNKTYVRLINRQYDKRFIKYSLMDTGASYNKILKLIEDIIDGDGKDGAMRVVISSMIEYFLIQSGKPFTYVGKGDFIVFMKSAFSSNTDAEQMVLIKSTIDKWLADNMMKYGKANYGRTVQIQYRRTLYMFFAYVINYEAKLL